MASERQIDANRKNAQKSTGPQTEEGKERSSQNSVKHGVLARALVIQGENIAMYQEFREQLFDDLHPVGAMEVLLVEKIVNYAWRLRRAIQAESILLQHGMTAEWPLKKLDDFFSGWEAQKVQNISRYETAIERHFYRSLKELKDMQAIRS